MSLCVLVCWESGVGLLLDVVVGQILGSLIGRNPRWAFSGPQGSSRTKPTLDFRPTAYGNGNSSPLSFVLTVGVGNFAEWFAGDLVSTASG